MFTPQRPAPERRARRGLTIIELIIAIWVMVLASSLFVEMLLSMSTLRRVNRERVEATEAAWTVLEAMRHEHFEEIFARYNADPADDPGGAGTAPGNRFQVKGLDALEGAPAGVTGEIVFPELTVEEKEPGRSERRGRPGPPEGPVGRDPIRIAGVTFPANATTSAYTLREDYVDWQLGMPRDLNGDNVIDDLDHRTDYLRLPVCVRMEWDGPNGPVALRVFTMFADSRTHTSKAGKNEDWDQRFDEFWKGTKKGGGNGPKGTNKTGGPR